MTSAETARPGTTTVVDRFLAAIENGQGAAMSELYAPDATLDATVPGWRFHRRGPEAIAAEYSRWFADAGRFEELDRHPLDDGELVTYLLAWEENGIPHAGHHCHVLSLDDSGRIRSDRVFCGGRWDATLLAEMATAQAAHDD